MLIGDGRSFTLGTKCFFYSLEHIYPDLHSALKTLKPEDEWMLLSSFRSGPSRLHILPPCFQSSMSLIHLTVFKLTTDVKSCLSIFNNCVVHNKRTCPFHKT